MRTGFKVAGLSAAIGVAMLATGCESAPRMGKFTYTVTVDPSVNSAVDVSFVGPQPADTTWDGLTAESFYGSPNLRNLGAIRTMSFRDSGPRTKSIEVGDSVWNEEWTGSEEVFVFTRSFGFDSDATTKVTLSRSSEDYNSGTEIKLLVDKTGIRPVTKTKSETEDLK